MIQQGVQTSSSPSSSQAQYEGAAELTGAVSQAVLETFAMICGDEEPSCWVVESGQSSGYASCTDGMVGIISFGGDLSWCLMLGMPRETATSLALAFTGMEMPYESEDMGDAIGELANVLAGAVTARMEDIGLKAQMSLPTVARGLAMELLLPNSFPAQQIPFSCIQGDFWVKVVVAHPHADHSKHHTS